MTDLHRESTLIPGKSPRAEGDRSRKGRIQQRSIPPSTSSQKPALTRARRPGGSSQGDHTSRQNEMRSGRCGSDLCAGNLGLGNQARSRREGGWWYAAPVRQKQFNTPAGHIIIHAVMAN